MLCLSAVWSVWAADPDILICTNRGKVNGLLLQDGTPQFTAICPDDVVPGMRKLMKDFNKKLAAIEPEWELQAEAGTVTWESLMEEHEKLLFPLDYAWGTVKHLVDVVQSPELTKARDTIDPEMVKTKEKMGSSEAFYRALWSMKNTPATWETLDDVQKRIVEMKIKDSENAGVALMGKKKERFDKVIVRISELIDKFAANVQESTKAFSLTIKDKRKLDGLPALFFDMYAKAAVDEGHQEATAEKGPWVITMDHSSVSPALQFINDRSMRKEIFLAYNRRASSGKFDNTPVIHEMLAFRREKANLLGYKNFADYNLESKMAHNVTAVERMILMLRESSYEPAKRELATLQAYAREKGMKEELEAWDMPYYTEHYKEEKFKMKPAEFRAYFTTTNVLDGMFRLAHHLFGVTVIPADGEAEVWHKDVRYFHLVDDATGGQIGSFFVDAFSRSKDKRGGNWMTPAITRSKVMNRTPLAYINCNGSPPTADTPSLLRFDEVQALIHEFGHALQVMLTEVPYGQASGINGIEWDAIEFPSQFMERWPYDRVFLDSFARHYQTGEVISEEVYDRLIKFRDYQAGLHLIRDLYLSELDMRLYSAYDPNNKDKTIYDIQAEVAPKYSVVKPFANDRHLCAFSHIFGGGYGAGYYCYKWADIMSADAFDAFEVIGFENTGKLQEIGERFRHTVLAMGGGTPPEEVFQLFLGRAPKPDALLKRSGLPPPTPEIAVAGSLRGSMGANPPEPSPAQGRRDMPGKGKGVTAPAKASTGQA